MLRPTSVSTCVATAVLAAACGGKPSGPTLSNRGAGATGCPSADRVRIATWTSGTNYMEGQPRWRLPLSIKELDGDYEVLDPQRTPAVPTTADALRAAGVAMPPPTVWMYRDTINGAAPVCAATIGAPYRSVGGDGAIYEELGVELVGCADPTQEDPFIGWVSLDEPTGCEFVPMSDGGGRMWDGETWTGQVAEGDPMPAALAPHVPPPPRGTASPAPTLLWAARAAKQGDRVLAWELATTYISAPPGTEACMISDITSNLAQLAGVGDAAVMVSEEAAGRLGGVLAAQGAARVLLVHGAGDYATYGVGPDGRPTTHGGARYYIPHEEDGFYYSLAPYCGP